HQGLARDPAADRLGQGVEQRLDKGLDIARLLEHGDLHAQPRGAGALVREGADRGLADVHLGRGWEITVTPGLGETVTLEQIRRPRNRFRLAAAWHPGVAQRWPRQAR